METKNIFLDLKSPLSGITLPIEDVPDQVFAGKMVGDGIGIDPIENILTSPCKGKVVQLHSAHHAITIQSENGNQILLHIGIDTVNLKGKGFRPLVKVGDHVGEGQELIEFDPDLIAAAGMSLVSVMVLIDDPKVTKFEYRFNHTSKAIRGRSSLATLNFNQKSGAVVMSKPDVHALAFESVHFYVRLPVGMHARPAARLAELTKNFRSEIDLIKGNKSAPLASIVSVLALEIGKDDEIIIVAVGPDAPQAVKAVLTSLVEIEEKELETFQKERLLQGPKTPTHINSDAKTFLGVSASDGIVMGNIAHIKQEKFSYEQKASDSKNELKQLESALESAMLELQRLEEEMHQEPANNNKTAIFGAHRAMLGDPELLDEVVSLINHGHSSAYAWDHTIQSKRQRLLGLKNELIAGRANDLKDIGNRVLRTLLGIKPKNLSQMENVILIAEDLTPSDTAQFDKNKILGFATTTGGATSHVAILARSMGIPAIAGIEKRALDIPEGKLAVLDADNGAIFLDPSPALQKEVEQKQLIREQKRLEALRDSGLQASTLDGHRIEVVANISGLSDAKNALEVGAEGVGLLRTEFLFLDREHAPTEEEQLEIYQSIADAMPDRPLIIRTMDVGGDKALAYLPMPHEENPFLGVRGIRLSLKKSALFREQLRAILRVKGHSKIHIMLPMIGQLEELLLSKRILEEERQKLNAPQVKLGIMIEVPSAAVMASQFAAHVDFFSIGTNDLTQYTLAMDRGHNELASQVDGLHPAVLHLIEMTIKGAHEHKKWVGICGGTASELKAVPILLGLGVDELSLSVPNIPLIKALIRKIDRRECEKVALAALKLTNGKEVRELVNRHWPEII
ncbi:MAG: phosphoenolpyruvate--protein phosphotransferase [Bdellovibrionales bacterium GWA2_49_15]|nr:MAG: phosphoenolpyruvate--protein phosphotransferase [Bdellovibrionales bacterium GWA2_49_15]